MANMLYNGVELPDIESVWGGFKTTYSNAVISSENHYFYLTITNGVIRVPDNNAWLVASGSSIGYRKYKLTDGVWIMDSSGSSLSSFDVIPSLNEDNYAVWASADVTYTDGTIYLAASDPVDPNAPTGLHLPSFYAGLAFSLAGPIIRGKSGSGMYSYNGVVLPKLPERDKESYPWLAMGKYEVGGDENYTYIYLYLLTAQPYPYYDAYRMTGGKKVYVCCLGDTEKWQVIEGVYYLPSDIVGDTWLYYEDEEHEDSFVFGADSLFWTNFDLYDADGNLYMAASSPVPM